MHAGPRARFFNFAQMEHADMIANYNPCTPPSLVVLWAWIGVCFLFSAVLIVLDALLRSRVLFGINLVENANRRAEQAEDAVIDRDEKIERLEAKVVNLEAINETLREKARRSGFLRDEEAEDHAETLRPRYTREQWADMRGAEEDDDYSIDL